MVDRCSPPIPLKLSHAKTCSRDVDYEDTVSGQSPMDKVLGQTRRDTSRKNEVYGSCGSAIQNVDYAPLLDPLSSRYIDNIPTVYAPVGYQAANMQVPQAFSQKGSEYANAAFMDSDAGCGQSFFTQAGFAPGNYFHPDFEPCRDQLVKTYSDQPTLVSNLLAPGIINTYMLASSDAQNAGRQVALYNLDSLPTTIDRLTIDPARLVPLSDETAARLNARNPGDRISKELTPLMGSLLSNVTSASAGDPYYSFAPTVAGIYNAPAGLIRQSVVDRQQRQAWEFANSGELNGQEALGVRSLNGSLAFAAYRAMLAKPYGTFVSGPITDSMQSGDLEPVDSMRFYYPPTPVNIFADYKVAWQQSLQP